MNKIILIIKREYLSRVRKKSFIVMTLLGPILMAGLIMTPILIDLLANENVEINVFILIKSSFYIVFFPIILGLIVKSIFKEMKAMSFYLPKISEFLIALIIGVILSLNFESFHNITSSLIIVIVLHNLL